MNKFLGKKFHQVYLEVVIPLCLNLAPVSASPTMTVRSSTSSIVAVPASGTFPAGATLLESAKEGIEHSLLRHNVVAYALLEDDQWKPK